MVGIMQYQFNGLVFGSKTPFVVESVSGLLGWDAAAKNTPSDTSHGAIPGLLNVQPRNVTFRIKVDAQKGAEAEGYLALLKKAFVPPSRELNVWVGDYETRGYSISPASWLLFKRPSWPEGRILFCRVNKVDIVSDYDLGSGFISMGVNLEAPDPVVYGENVTTMGSGTYVQRGDHPDGYYPRVTGGGSLSASCNGMTVAYSGVPGSIDVDFRTRVSKPLGSGLKLTSDEFWSAKPGSNSISTNGTVYLRAAWL